MSQPVTSFDQLGLSPALLKAIKQIGYEQPSPIQAEGIPPFLEGRDILGQAQTGTGKTAAFALPLLQMINPKQKKPQVLVLTPTRELAIQVAEAFQSYASFLSTFHVLPVYGGQSYEGQIRALKRGVHVVVGTPGRVMDHMRKGTLKLDELKHLVLDEADEMLRMGFIDDVKWVLTQTPSDRQIALFSATMPKEIAKVANTYLDNPEHIQIKAVTTTAETIRQRYWPVQGMQKLDALTRILEAEPFDAMIIFVRTKTSTVELAEKLEARGYSASALNGDITQKLRERTVESLKNKKIDILVATDVAARGLDVERISHVLNYDIPYDTEAYVHRIGRTGRAGRKGDAILFVAKREIRMLRAIEKATSKKIQEMDLPSVKIINEQRLVRFKESISETLESQSLDFFRGLIDGYRQEHDADPLDIAAALAHLMQGENPLLLQDRPIAKNTPSQKTNRKDKGVPEDVSMNTYRIEVGRQDKVSPGNIVGAIANEAGIDSEYIGRIKIHDAYSTVDLPEGMPSAILKSLQKAWVCQKQLNITLADGSSPVDDERGSRKKKFGKGRGGDGDKSTRHKKPRHKKSNAKKPAARD